MYRVIRETFRDYRDGRIDASELVVRLNWPKPKPPDPQKICTIITIANMIGPMIAPMMGYVWVPIPLPAYCTMPVTGETEHRVEIGKAVFEGLWE